MYFGDYYRCGRVIYTPIVLRSRAPFKLFLHKSFIFKRFYFSRMHTAASDEMGAFTLFPMWWAFFQLRFISQKQPPCSEYCSMNIVVKTNIELAAYNVSKRTVRKLLSSRPYSTGKRKVTKEVVGPRTISV